MKLPLEKIPVKIERDRERKREEIGEKESQRKNWRKVVYKIRLLRFEEKLIVITRM